MSGAAPLPDAESSRIHQARLRPGRRELLSRESVWQELDALGATIATVPFSGRAGRGGRTDRIVLSRVDRNELVDVELWTGRDELCYALEAPIWDRFGSFTGQPLIDGTVIWTAAGQPSHQRGPLFPSINEGSSNSPVRSSPRPRRPDGTDHH